jgi:hypothetical protein
MMLVADTSRPPVATEPFDEILDRRIKGMDAERLKWETETAERRKKRPAEIHQLEDNLEERNTWAMWLPEGEDEDTGEWGVGVSVGVRRRALRS